MFKRIIREVQTIQMVKLCNIDPMRFQQISRKVRPRVGDGDNLNIHINYLGSRYTRLRPQPM